MSAPPKQIAELQGKLVVLLGEIRGTPIAERVTLYVAKLGGGRKLSEIVGDAGVPVTEKVTILRCLVEILLSKDYARLPELPVAEQAPTLPVVAPVATPAQLPAEMPADEADEPEAAPLASFTPAQLVTLRREIRREMAKVLATMAKVLAQ